MYEPICFNLTKKEKEKTTLLNLFLMNELYSILFLTIRCNIFRSQLEDIMGKIQF